MNDGRLLNGAQTVAWCDSNEDDKEIFLIENHAYEIALIGIETD